MNLPSILHRPLLPGRNPCPPRGAGDRRPGCPGVLRLLILAIPAGEAFATRIPDFGLGYEVDVGVDPPVPIPPESAAVSASRPLHLRVKVRRADVEPAAGRADWSLLDRILRTWSRAIESLRRDWARLVTFRRS